MYNNIFLLPIRFFFQDIRVYVHCSSLFLYKIYFRHYWNNYITTFYSSVLVKPIIRSSTTKTPLSVCLFVCHQFRFTPMMYYKTKTIFKMGQQPTQTWFFGTLQQTWFFGVFIGTLPFVRKSNSHLAGLFISFFYWLRGAPLVQREGHTVLTNSYYLFRLSFLLCIE